MPLVRHEFTNRIDAIIRSHFPENAEDILDKSLLIQYLNIKTKAANRGSKSRAGFANHYAIYVLVEDYLNNGFDISGGYTNYEGAQFSVLFICVGGSGNQRNA